jgi:hypothetical protein
MLQLETRNFHWRKSASSIAWAVFCRAWGIEKRDKSLPLRGTNCGLQLRDRDGKNHH